MARRRNPRSTRRIWPAWVLVSAMGIGGYALFISPLLEGDAEPEAVVANGVSATTPAAPPAAQPFAPSPRLTTNRPVDESVASETVVSVPERGEKDKTTPPRPVDPQQAKRATSLFDAGLDALGMDELVSARAHFNEALALGLSPDKDLEARSQLTVIGEKTIFGTAMPEDDPFVGRHVVAPGESLQKIAARYDVSDDLLARINGIANKNMIRAGRSLKIIHGPFNAVIRRNDFTLDVYLQNTFIKRYKVGLGADGNTPIGEWKVGAKLVNPTYYPPRGGNIVSADDPENPLGERWIELVGISGDALGQEGYGIHGTIEPDSIGQNMSLGCVRLYNEDVAELYALLITEKSHVRILP